MPEEVVPEVKKPVKFFDRIPDLVRLVQEVGRVVENARGMAADLIEAYRMKAMEGGQVKAEQTGDTSNVENIFKGPDPGSPPIR